VGRFGDVAPEILVDHLRPIVQHQKKTRENRKIVAAGKKMGPGAIKRGQWTRACHQLSDKRGRGSDETMKVKKVSDHLFLQSFIKIKECSLMVLYTLL
jgi:hypothetical protein